MMKPQPETPPPADDIDIHNDDVVKVGRWLAQDDGEAARSHLAAGRPIYYHSYEFPENLIKEYPDGRRELVTWKDGKDIFVRAL